MQTWQAVLLAVGVVRLLYAAGVAWLVVRGRRSDARALAGFVPDCVVLFRRLLGDPRVSRWRKAVVGLVVVYLAMPIDLVPDFIPVAGQLDDLLVVALALRVLLRGGNEDLLREHWPGPEGSLRLVERAASAGSPAASVE